MRSKALLLLAAALFAGGGAAAHALAGDGVDALEALDVAFPHAGERIQRSVVAIEVDRDERPQTALTPREKMGLGLGTGSVYDARYFTRPAGPCTGVVLATTDKTALIATTIWNVRDQKAMRLVMPNGEKRKLTLKGRDENLDIQILVADDPSGLVAATFAPQRHIGQFAVLVGRGGERNAPTITVGNLSAVGRHKGDSLQVSTRMNYGNVGGAVADLDGNLLGIATRLTDRPMQGLNSGVGFAAPIDRIKAQLKVLAEGKIVPKRKNPFLGIQGDLKPLPEGKQGVRIEKVMDGMAAKTAGLLDGDVVKIFNGVEVKDFEQLRDEIQKLEAGEKVIVTIERGDKGEKDFTIELGARPPEQGDE
jgi:S1-C subfamily serine protease